MVFQRIDAIIGARRAANASQPPCPSASVCGTVTDTIKNQSVCRPQVSFIIIDSLQTLWARQAPAAAAMAPLFRRLQGKRKGAYNSTYLVALSITAVGVFVLYCTCAVLLLAATPDGTQGAREGSQQHAWASWQSSRRMQMTLTHKKQAAGQHAAAKEAQRQWASFWASDAPQGELACQPVTRTPWSAGCQQMQQLDM